MCTLNEDDMCLGCGRMLNEITSWVSYSESKQAEVTEDCDSRLLALEKQSVSLEKSRKS